MQVTLKNGKNAVLQRLSAGDYPALSRYLFELSPQTRKRFEPHAFGEDAIREIYGRPEASYRGYIAKGATHAAQIIAYAVVYAGYLAHDRERLESYGLQLDRSTDATFAPSVADAWQGCGLGDAMFRFVSADLLAAGYRRIILWGGVQSDNIQAIRYYQKHGFRTLGQFEYFGWNQDMIADIS